MALNDPRREASIAAFRMKLSLRQMLLDDLKQLAQVERLPQKIVSERCAESILPSYMSGEENDGNVFCQCIGLQLPAEYSTVFFMQEDIEQYEVYVVAHYVLEN